MGILGNNGIGKTTFLKVLCGLIASDEGSITINQHDVLKHRTNVMRGLGVLLDGSRGLYWRLSAWQNYLYFSSLKGVFGEMASKQGEFIFKFFKIWDVRHLKVETFSLGMKQKLAICCTLAHKPNVLLLDEPTTGLDADSKELFKEIIQYQLTDNRTVVIAGHDIDLLKNLKSQLFTIEKGCFKESLL